MNQYFIRAEVKRDAEDIVEEMIPHRNSKVEKGVDLPIGYKAVVNVAADTAEDGFYETYAESEIRMQPQPGAMGSAQDIAEIISHTSDTETDLKVKPEGIVEHAPVIQEGMDAFEANGYRTGMEFYKDFNATTVTELIEEVEEQGVRPRIYFKEMPLNLQTEDPTHHYYVDVLYNSEEKLLNPEVKVAMPANANEEEAEQIESELEEVLEEEGLLE